MFRGPDFWYTVVGFTSISIVKIRTYHVTPWLVVVWWIDWLIDWCLTTTSAVFQLFCGSRWSHTVSLTHITEWVSDCWLMHGDQFFSYIMATRSYILMRWWRWCPLCWIFIVLTHWNKCSRTYIHSEHIFLIPSQSKLSSYSLMLCA